MTKRKTTSPQIYTGHDEVLASIRRVQTFLEVSFITEGCREDRMFGCASCQAVGIHETLEMLAHEVEDDAALTPSSAPSPQLGPSENTVNSEVLQRGD